MDEEQRNETKERELFEIKSVVVYKNTSKKLFFESLDVVDGKIDEKIK